MKYDRIVAYNQDGTAVVILEDGRAAAVCPRIGSVVVEILPDSFLKFGGFTAGEPSDDLQSAIQKTLDNPSHFFESNSAKEYLKDPNAKENLRKWIETKNKTSADQ